MRILSKEVSRRHQSRLPMFDCRWRMLHLMPRYFAGTPSDQLENVHHHYELARVVTPFSFLTGRFDRSRIGPHPLRLHRVAAAKALRPAHEVGIGLGALHRHRHNLDGGMPDLDQ